MWPLSRKGASGFSSSSTAEEVTQGIDGTGLTAIVTGASSGIGAETARVLALRGVHVIMGVIDMIGAKNVKESILKATPLAKVDVMELDLSSMESVQNFAAEFNSSGLPLNILINNAGIFAAPFMLSKDNIELQFAINYVGHFLLTNLLLDTMKKTTRKSKKQGRIVIVSSAAHRLTYRERILFDKINDQSSYNNWLAYGQSKLANILHANELARRLKEDGIDITVNSLHPGATLSNIYIHNRLLTGLVNILGPSLVGNIVAFVAKNVQQAAATTCYVTLHPQVNGISGKYFVDNNIGEAHLLEKDKAVATTCYVTLHPQVNGISGKYFVDNNIGEAHLLEKDKAAATTCYVTLHPQVNGISGKYFVDNNIGEAHLLEKDMDLAKKLWDFSIKLTK